MILIQQFEQSMRAGLNPRRLMFPLGKRNALGSDFGVEIIFQIDGQRVARAVIAGSNSRLGAKPSRTMMDGLDDPFKRRGRGKGRLRPRYCGVR